MYATADEDVKENAEKLLNFLQTNLYERLRHIPAMRMIAARTQSDGETVSQFHVALQNLAQRLFPDKPAREMEDLVRDCFLENVRSELVPYIAAQKPGTLAEALRAAKDAELRFGRASERLFRLAPSVLREVQEENQSEHDDDEESDGFRPRSNAWGRGDQERFREGRRQWSRESRRYPDGEVGAKEQNRPLPRRGPRLLRRDGENPRSYRATKPVAGRSSRGVKSLRDEQEYRTAEENRRRLPGSGGPGPRSRHRGPAAGLWRPGRQQHERTYEAHGEFESADFAASTARPETELGQKNFRSGQLGRKGKWPVARQGARS